MSEDVEPVTDPDQLPEEWRSLYDWLVLDPTCECCTRDDLKAEALAIVNASRIAKPQTQGSGCIICSLTLLTQLQLQLGNHVTAVRSGTVQGINIFGTRTARTWIEIETHCYMIKNVAWWWGFFRHQAVLVYPKCHRLGYLNPLATVIDLWGPALRVWSSWRRWAGGMSNVNVTVGRVRDLF